MKVALVYDRVNKWGGAERVLLALHKLFPEAPLFTSVYGRKKTAWAHEFNVRTSFLQSAPWAKETNELFPLLMPISFESFSFDEYDAVISVTSEAAKGIITKPTTLHVCLCLTPTRYLWSAYDEYFHNAFLRTLAAPVISYLKAWDRVAASRPDFYIAISQTVATRIKTYYERDSEVIYPPVEFRASEEETSKTQKPYFLVVSRLSKFVPYKKVDLAIEAANKLGLPLKIVGDGDISYFREKAGKTVEFLGRLTDSELSYYYKNCEALIFPGVEDFGLVMVEAQAHGAPIIAYRGGGSTEIIQEGKTGEFFDAQTVRSLAHALETFDKKKYNSKDCADNAARFSAERFEKEFMEYFDEKVKEYFKFL